MTTNALWTMLLLTMKLNSISSQSGLQLNLPKIAHCGKSTILTCNQDNPQNQTCQWNKDQTPIIRNGSVITHHSQLTNKYQTDNNSCILTIKNVTLSDQGLYQCQIDFTKSENKILLVACADLNLTVQLKDGKCGEDTTLICKQKHDLEHFKSCGWYSDTFPIALRGELMTNTSLTMDKYTVTINYSSCFLQIRNANMSDQRLYMCGNGSVWTGRVNLNIVCELGQPRSIEVKDIQTTSAVISWNQYNSVWFDNPFLIHIRKDNDAFKNASFENLGMDQLNRTSVRLNNLEHSSTYYVQVFATDVQNTSNFTETLSFTTIREKSGYIIVAVGAGAGAVLCIALIVTTVVFVRSFRKVRKSNVTATSDDVSGEQQTDKNPVKNSNTDQEWSEEEFDDVTSENYNTEEDYLNPVSPEDRYGTSSTTDEDSNYYQLIELSKPNSATIGSRNLTNSSHVGSGEAFMTQKNGRHYYKLQLEEHPHEQQRESDIISDTYVAMNRKSFKQ